MTLLMKQGIWQKNSNISFIYLIDLWTFQARGGTIMITSSACFYYIGHTTSLNWLLWLNWNINYSNIFKCDFFLSRIFLTTTSICFNSLRDFLRDLRSLSINFYSLYDFLSTAIKSHLTSGKISVEFMNPGFFSHWILHMDKFYWDFQLLSINFMPVFWGESLRGNDTELKQEN